MSLALAAGGHPAHFPKDPNKFEFDSEVSEIFPVMARQSIPLFYETHALHAGLCQHWMLQDEVSILDIGASRGAFITALSALYNLKAPGVTVKAGDYSPDMCAHLALDFPWLNVQRVDVTSDAFMASGHEAWDIINCTYVIQFVHPDRQLSVLKKLVRMLKPGGVLFLGQKMSSLGPAGRMLHLEYIKFRMSQGYTAEEITAKTKALAGSMWTFPDQVLVDYLNKYGLEVMETSRWTVFNNFMCTKGL